MNNTRLSAHSQLVRIGLFSRQRGGGHVFPAGCRRLVAALVFLGGSALVAQDQTVSGNITVTGNALVQGGDGFNATDETATLFIGDSASYVRAIYDRGMTFGQNGVERMRIQGGTGNVGIGTANPDNKLTIDAGGALGFYRGASGKSMVGIDYLNVDGGAGDVMRFLGSVSGQTFDRVNLVIARATGSVGIGTTTLDSMLNINGGTAMTAGWNRTLSLRATYPVLLFESTAAGKRAGFGYDGTAAFRFWINGGTNDLSGTGSQVFAIDNTTGNTTWANNVTYTGNIGIGANPTLGQLHVSGNATAGSGPNRPRLALEDTAGGAWVIQPWSTAGGDGHLFVTRNSGTGHIVLGLGTERVGIGTTPTVKLDVAGDIKASGNVTITGTLSAASWAANSFSGGTSGLALNAGGSNQNIQLAPSGSGKVRMETTGTSGADTRLLRLGINQTAAGSTASLEFGTTSYDALAQVRGGVESGQDGFLAFHTRQGGSVAERMRITSSGAVGIGITSASYLTGTNGTPYKLSVEGSVHAKEVVVDAGAAAWADYVFAPGYRNAPLAELEQHIQAHQHLPGVPSAQEVAEKGVNIGKMQALLLAKVEELTLHMIAQEKHMNEQERHMAEQEKRIKRLEEENAALRTR